MKIAGWFRRNNTIMAQAKDLSRQLQEAWEGGEKWETAAGAWKTASIKWEAAYHKRSEYLREQLHRVARERDQERKKRLAAEDALLDMYLDDSPYYELLHAVEKKHPNETRHETALRYIRERENQVCRASMAKDYLDNEEE